MCINLPDNGFPRGAVAGMEGGVVAIRAASNSDRAVTVGAAETGVDHQFLQPFAIEAAITSGGSVISFTLREVKHLAGLVFKAIKLH